MTRTITHLRQISDHLTGAKRLVFHPGICEPSLIAHQLVECVDLWPELIIEPFMPAAHCPYVGLARLKVETVMPGPHLRQGVATGEVKIIRETLHEQALSYANGKRRADILVLQVSTPDAQGNVSLGPSLCAIPQLLDQAAYVFGVINPSLPKTNAKISLAQINAVLERDVALPDLPVLLPGNTDRKIAEHVLSILPENCVVEIGIGTTPDAIMRALVDLEHVKVHAGLINDALMHLVENGNVAGKVTTTLAQGSSAFHTWLDGNSKVDFQPIMRTHDAGVIGKLDRFHAINGALQVDLEGNVNAERIAGRIVSCPGGLPDFAKGARLSKGGRNIIVLRSTVGNSGQSTIVDKVDFKTLDGSLVDMVVTEYGIAAISGLNTREKARAISSIANPNHRIRHNE
ncbi:MAG: acetyl-CoA hydrolase/transferase C-terminal domain-containing protein [Rhizobiaceae bacterium]